MNDLEALECITNFLKENVASKIMLKKAPDYNIGEEGIIGQEDTKIELVNPAVYTGWVPPKNFLDNYGYDIPGLIAMIDDGIDDVNEANVNFRIKIVTYDLGLTDENNNVTPNTKGYKDLLNIIMRIRLEFSQNPILNEKLTINKPIKWSMDEDQSYPYWSANITFDASIAPLDFNIEKYFE
ncbi:UNVERIFIED_ORG: hypothetical protein B2H98_08870 [Clostridium botulinum]|nr:hypothetical protein [Clostridium botulinum]NFR14773.1 hypothetical protein [Clostridium botulinum]NFR44755.1 hypothetical protein [Clostridium botulinum]NFS51626.1 hypothetical protein [Clostridium botulinum]